MNGEPTGSFHVERAGYHLSLTEDGRHAVITSPSGAHSSSVDLLGAFDTTDTTDETTAFRWRRVDDGTIAIERTSTRWDRAGAELRAGERSIELRCWVEGSGTLTDVHLGAGRVLAAGQVGGLSCSTTSMTTLFSPNPGDPAKIVRSAAESAVIGVSGAASGGRGHWFFTPAPLCFAVTTDAIADPDEPAPAGWTTIAVEAPVDEMNFVEITYRASDRAFELVLDYDAHAVVDGRFEAPTVLITPGFTTPWEGLRFDADRTGRFTHRRRSSAISRGASPDWWREPMFCGWGAQCALSARDGVPAAALATESNYAEFLATLASHGVVPSTIAIDDKWQATYGLNEPDTSKWPDLRRFIGDRHGRGQHTLLWWKAWDPEGLPPELCIRTAEGVPVALDPSNPLARDALGEVVATMLAEDGLGADGLKIDFTARTPVGRALSQHGSGWGIALLHDLLSIVYAAAKRADPEALVITQSPHAAFADVTDMVRLNDMLRLDDPGAMLRGAVLIRQMRYRAQVVAATDPDVLIDTDDWATPDLETWRAYLTVKPQLGVPSLYYSSHIDISGEPLTDDDYERVRLTWDEWRSRR
ncbi:MAG TPA: hypothetical protein VGC84_00230 [Ilumatobacteraceae bacterium]